MNSKFICLSSFVFATYQYNCRYVFLFINLFKENSMTQIDSTVSDFADDTVPAKEKLGWSLYDTNWMLTLFGTAIGAGVLFLPINAGLGGIWPLIILSVLALPMTFLSHRALSRFVLASPVPGEDITAVAETFFGKNIGFFITLLYFFSIVPIVMVYGVSITNTVDSFVVNQLGMESPSRPLLSGVLIILMMAVFHGGEKVLTTITSWLVYPLSGILFFLAVYLIPDWNLSMFQAPIPGLGDMSKTILLCLPVVVFSFSHTPIISYFSLSMQRTYGKRAEAKASQIIFNNACIIWFLVIFFVFSSVLSLSPDDLMTAKEQNISVLSYLANIKESPFISYCGPIVAFLAIASSFFGHYAGTIEGLYGLLSKFTRQSESQGAKFQYTRAPGFRFGVPVVLFFFIWYATIKNPSVLSVIETISGPVIAAILFLMPMIAIHTVPALHKYSGKVGNIFIVITGSAAVSCAFVSAFL